MTHVIDACFTPDGQMVLLTPSAIYRQERGGAAFQHMAQSERPMVWVKVADLGQITPSRLILRGSDDVFVVDNVGQVWRHTFDQSSIGLRPQFVWRQVGLPQE